MRKASGELKLFLIFTSQINHELPMQPEKFPLTSHDIVDQNIDRLRAIFPEIVTEDGKIDWDMLKLTLGENIDVGKERYGMTWPGKADCFKVIQAPSRATLLPMASESMKADGSLYVEMQGFSTDLLADDDVYKAGHSDHLMIEGDNLEVLKLLQKSYLGKVKMIYIDPPYNTGKDFVYKDNFGDNLRNYLEYTGQTDDEGRKITSNADTDGRYHTNWLNMMYPRLYLAKNLLREDGVIFISIDDNEQANLKKLCDEIFGEENFVANVVWKHTEQSKNDERHFSRNYNHLIVISKNIESLESFRTSRSVHDNKNYSNPDNDPNGDWRSGDVRSPSLRKTLQYKIETPNGGFIDPPENGWRWSKKELLEKIERKEILFVSNETKILRKIYLSNQDGRISENLWVSKGTTREANSEIKGLFEDHVFFDTPKPTLLLKHIISHLKIKNSDIILDFFAGSGTTAHAVMALNQEDGGSRQYICVQLPEQTDESSEAHKAGYNTIAEITKERIRRASAKIKGELEAERSQPKTGDLFAETDGKRKSPLDLGMRVFKLAPSCFKAWDAGVEKTPEAIQTALDLHIDHVDESLGQEALLYELLLKSGFPLTTDVQAITITGLTVYNVDQGNLMICLEQALTQEVIEGIAALSPIRVICLDEGFRNNDQLKTNAVKIMQSAGVVKFMSV
jgi:adenine-specific DNA-methyltransferase